MPYATVQIIKEATKAEKAQLVGEMTDSLVRILKKKPEHTHTVYTHGGGLLIYTSKTPMQPCNARSTMRRSLRWKPETGPYGDRQGGVKDQHGNIWLVLQWTVHEPYTP